MEINYRKLIQCDKCLEDLDEFLELQVGDKTTSIQTYEALEQYTLFLEIKRLRKDKLKNSIPNPFNTFPLFNTPGVLYPDDLVTGRKVIC
jgi:hypothetical protein